MTLDPGVVEIAQQLAAAGLRPLAGLTPTEARDQVAVMRQAMASSAAADESDVPRVEDVTIDAGGHVIPARWYEPAAPVAGVVVFAHGGGWVLGTLDDADLLCRRVAESTSCSVLSVDYRLAPEHVFPAAVDDVYAAFLWSARRSRDLPILLMGDSAGGNLAAAVALRALADEDGPEPSGQILVYPVTDHDFETPSYRAHGEVGPFLTRSDMEWFWDHYAPTDEARAHHWASPLRATDLAGAAPAIVVLAGHDVLHDEGARYADALARAGVEVIVLDYPDLAHGFLSMLATVEAAELPFQETAAAIRALLA